MKPDDALVRTLKKVVLDVFEQMYFMFPQEMAPECSAAMEGREVRAARVGIRHGGMELMIAASPPLVREMAKNMFGEEKEPSAQELEDVIREAANIISGNMINEYGFSGEVAPDIPVAAHHLDRDFCSEKNRIVQFYTLDREVFCAALTWSSAAQKP